MLYVMKEESGDLTGNAKLGSNPGDFALVSATTSSTRFNSIHVSGSNLPKG